MIHANVQKPLCVAQHVIVNRDSELGAELEEVRLVLVVDFWESASGEERPGGWGTEVEGLEELVLVGAEAGGGWHSVD